MWRKHWRLRICTANLQQHQNLSRTHDCLSVPLFIQNMQKTFLENWLTVIEGLRELSHVSCFRHMHLKTIIDLGHFFRLRVWSDKCQVHFSCSIQTASRLVKVTKDICQINQITKRSIIFEKKRRKTHTHKNVIPINTDYLALYIW